MMTRTISLSLSLSLYITTWTGADQFFVSPTVAYENRVITIFYSPKNAIFLLRHAFSLYPSLSILHFLCSFCFAAVPSSSVSFCLLLSFGFLGILNTALGSQLNPSFIWVSAFISYRTKIYSFSFKRSDNMIETRILGRRHRFSSILWDLVRVRFTFCFIFFLLFSRFCFKCKPN